MKTIYIVTGSEDGVIGAASNMKAAYRIAKDYIISSCDADRNVSLIQSYSKTCKKLRSGYHSVSLTEFAATFGDSFIEAVNLESK
jgi:hypothetical protein